MSDMDHFGRCPECGRTDGYLNHGRVHYFVCHEHRSRWYVGENLFSSWRNESEGDWVANRLRLAEYEEIEPVHDIAQIGVLLGFDVESLTEGTA